MLPGPGFLRFPRRLESEILDSKRRCKGAEEQEVGWRRNTPEHNRRRTHVRTIRLLKSNHRTPGSWERNLTLMLEKKNNDGTLIKNHGFSAEEKAVAP